MLLLLCFSTILCLVSSFLVLLRTSFDNSSFVHKILLKYAKIHDLVLFDHSIVYKMNNYFGDIEMEQESDEEKIKL